MKGYIRKRGKRSYSLQWYVGRDEKGKPQYRTKTVRGTRKQADAEMARIIHEVETGEYVDPPRITVSAYLEHWLAAMESNVSARTWERYSEIIRKHLTPALGRRELRHLKSVHIQGCYTKALADGRRDGKGGLSAQTVLHHHRVLRKALQDAVGWNMLARNPCAGVKPPRPVRATVRTLSRNEIGLILKVASPEMYVPVLLAVTTGMRRGELLALRWEDVDLDRAILQVRSSLEQTRAGVAFTQPKTPKARRAVALPEAAVSVLRQQRVRQAEARRMLEQYYKDLDLVCADPDGSMIRPSAFSKRWQWLVSKAKVAPAPFHALRHTHATMLLQAGVHPRIVQERLGHSTISVTMDTYSHVLPSMQTEAAKKVDVMLSADNVNITSTLELPKDD